VLLEKNNQNLEGFVDSLGSNYGPNLLDSLSIMSLYMCQRALNQCICISNVNFEDSKEKEKKRGDRLVIIF